MLAFRPLPHARTRHPFIAPRCAQITHESHHVCIGLLAGTTTLLKDH